mmetsp:Transcript_27170/g.45514  ORF Transcript_27170/g.45514 Transcript_27170/m.45514 type:complete len:371 (-) Transcript_27170:160-1272(-)
MQFSWKDGEFQSSALVAASRFLHLRFLLVRNENNYQRHQYVEHLKSVLRGEFPRREEFLVDDTTRHVAIGCSLESIRVDANRQCVYLRYFGSTTSMKVQHDSGTFHEIIEFAHNTFDGSLQIKSVELHTINSVSFGMPCTQTVAKVGNILDLLVLGAQFFHHAVYRSQGAVNGARYTFPFTINVNAEQNCLSFAFLVHKVVFEEEATTSATAAESPSNRRKVSMETEVGPPSKGSEVVYFDVPRGKVLRIDTLRHTPAIMNIMQSQHQPDWVIRPPSIAMILYKHSAPTSLYYDTTSTTSPSAFCANTNNTFTGTNIHSSLASTIIDPIRCTSSSSNICNSADGEIISSSSSSSRRKGSKVSTPPTKGTS